MNKVADGPPGKFYKSEHALVLLDSLKLSDSYARLVLDKGADHNQSGHFGKLVARLQTGELVRR